MTDAVGWGVAFGLAVFLAWLLWDRANLTRWMRESNDRLYAAWKDGATIPPPPPDDQPELEEETPFDGLPEPILAWLEQWEGDEAKERWAKRARALLEKHKGNVVKTLVELDEPSWRGA